MEGAASRIFRGKEVRAHKYPWLAYIRLYSKSSYRPFPQCSGSLIDERHVITAANCLVGKNGLVFEPSAIDVFLGRVKSVSEKTKATTVSEIWVDPDFNPQDLSNDFAILTLSEPVNFTQQIAPVCLPNSENELIKLTVAGWGATTYYSPSSDNLLEVDVDYLTPDQCNDIKTDYIMNQNGLPQSMKGRMRTPKVRDTLMCAINKQTKGDTCSGDSGGPLMFKNATGLNYLMGVVSGSWTECGTSDDTAGLYTRVLRYQDTIKSIAPNACWKD
ncbi:venom protease-like [Panonychus citri]|uniref:venom protease-like n=1 Tax=Panonychus citri TaxID=50023 RepID=UPI002307090C|nr:venom protease-like [Panonychus citri]